MDSEESIAATVRATLALLDATDTVPAVYRTIHRPSPPSDAVDLPELTFSAADLVTVREIGRGGMGVVHLAEQRSLGREVAVKMSASTEEAIVCALIREGRIMGALEHPNVVPVHSLGLDATGGPMLVMKRIDGATWRELLDTPDHPAWKPLLAGHGDKLRSQVEILMQVSSALAFAHNRGVVHRDLKPENVMIGGFGEIYVLDWGAALRLSERATEAPSLVGTPGYLAPEMAHADPMLVDERTDVYLLGATLYEVLAGRMPHDATSVSSALMMALSDQAPPIPEGANAELVQIVRKAMALDKDRRFPSAESFREALARFLVSRDADMVAADAREALARGMALIATEGPASASAFRALIEARFGFASAHRMRPNDPSLRAELDASIARLVEREVGVRSPASARALLAELRNPGPELVSSIDALEEGIRLQESAAEEIRKTRREADLTRMVRPTAIVIVVTVTVGVMAGVFTSSEAVETGGFPVWQAITLDVALLMVSLVAFALGRKAFVTEASRRVVTLLLIMLVGMGLSDLLTFALGRGTSEAAAHALTLMALMTTAIGVSVTRRVLIAVPVVAAAVVGIVAAPRFAPLFAMGALIISGVVFVAAFRRHAATTKSE